VLFLRRDAVFSLFDGRDTGVTEECVHRGGEELVAEEGCDLCSPSYLVRFVAVKVLKCA
jgi:hypothetical protein